MGISKAWICYSISNNKFELDKRIYYPRIIRKTTKGSESLNSKVGKPHTIYSITEKGKDEFRKLRERLFEVLK
jgi:hypothetical protein